MKNILIYINDSLGELDWISPFIKSEEGQKFNFYFFLNGPGRTYDDKMNILTIYELKKENIYYLNSHTKIDFYLFKIDEFLNKVLGQIKKYSFPLFTFFRSFFDSARSIFSYLPIRDNKIKFDYIFRDYNLKESFSLHQYMRMNSNAKIVIFPHAVGLQKKHIDCPREPIRILNADLWLENSNLSDIAKTTEAYKDVFFASGVPAFDVNYRKQSLFQAHAKQVLIITRDCGMVFGFTYKDAFKVFDTLLSKLEKMGYHVAVKHHPRDKKVQEWRRIQKKYSNVTEISESLNDLDTHYSACFTLFSTAALFLLSRQIPVFEISPYKPLEEYSNKMPMHYADKSKVLTHDLLSLQLYKRLDNLNNLPTYMDESYLTSLSHSQYQKCQDIFPIGANSKICNKITSLIDV